MKLQFKERLSMTKIIPALRGLSAEEAHGVAETLLDLGTYVLEVPIRTKNPATSEMDADAMSAIKFLIEHFSDRASVVAGTVTRIEDISVLADLGISECFSLNLHPELIQTATQRGISFIPGVETVSEAIEATRLGAAGLKLFPAVIREPDGGSSVRLTPGYVSYLSRFISVPIIPSGNAFDNGIAGTYLRSGAAAVNVGAQLYEPRISLEELRTRFQKLQKQLD